jgi:hypothetical protein
MPIDQLGPSCFTYIPVRCYICNDNVVPDDREVVLRSKRYVCICLKCYDAISSANKNKTEAISITYKTIERYESQGD